MHEISVTLDELDKAIEEINYYKEEVKEIVNGLIIALVKEGVQVAKAEILRMQAWDSGSLYNSILGFFDPVSRVGIIRTGVPHAVYVEFGTGIVGKGLPHPEAGMHGWIYDINNHGEAGWFYYNPNYDSFFVTKGMPSRPFMYNTVRILQRQCREIAMREVFGR